MNSGPNIKENDRESYADRARRLLVDQKSKWELLAENYSALSGVKTKSFSFGRFEVKVQYNPGRIKSSAADVSEEAINSRTCFLCFENLPPEQEAVNYNKNFFLLCNPYPIFEEHFTIVKSKHSPQSITENFEALLDLSRDLGKYYSVFYNGPKCGASAPDHMHFQAASAGIIPSEREIDSIREWGETVYYGNGKAELFFVKNYIRSLIIVESANKNSAAQFFYAVVEALNKLKIADGEPMLNIISSFSDKWRILIFPRFKHRPKEFFASGNGGILVSPAAVDMGGLLIAPRQLDYEKLNAEKIAGIYRQVSLPKEYFEYVIKKSVELLRSKIKSPLSK